MTRTELRYGLIAGVLLIGTLFLDKAVGLGLNTAGGTPALTGFMALIFIIVYAMRDINKLTPYASIKDAFLSGLSIAFLGGIFFGLYSLCYVKYIDPNYVASILPDAKKLKLSPTEAGNMKRMMESYYSPFSQLLAGLGVCVTMGAITGGITAWVLRPKK